MKRLPLVAAAFPLALAGCGGFPDLDPRFTERAAVYPSLEPVEPLEAERDIALIPEGTTEGLAARRDALIARSSGVNTGGLSLAERERLEEARTRQVALAPRSELGTSDLAARGDALRSRGELITEARNSVLLRDAGQAIAEAESLPVEDETLIARTEALREHRDKLAESDERASVALSELSAADAEPTEAELELLERTAELRARAAELRRRAAESETN